jgi:hypothetical protein
MLSRQHGLLLPQMKPQYKRKTVAWGAVAVAFLHCEA